jgi:alkylation response protein AidB-like acyl-CoA dehydrogenase
MDGMTLKAELTRPDRPSQDLTQLASELFGWSAALRLQAEEFPTEGLALLQKHGFWGTGLPTGRGGPTLDGPGLLRLLRLVGRASLALGRLFEGHVNALALITAYGTAGQQDKAVQDVLAGKLFGVWNTEGPVAMQLVRQHGTWTLQGAKTFASGGRHVARPLLPVDSPEGRQLVLLRADAPTSQVRERPESWQPLGMAATQSVTLDFSGTVLDEGDLIGAAGDYYRQPMFTSGALRFCAVQLGGADALLAAVRGYLTQLGRAADDVQRLRFADAWLAMQAAVLALAQGERLEEAARQRHGDEEALLAQVDAVRLATENACLNLLEAAERAVGARGLLEPEPFPRLIRDLRMYLRQPAPDAARLRLGRWVLEGGSERVDASDPGETGLHGR